MKRQGMKRAPRSKHRRVAGAREPAFFIYPWKKGLGMSSSLRHLDSLSWGTYHVVRRFVPLRDLDPKALMILERRYLMKDDEGRPTETPEEMFRRVASAISEAEENYGRGLREEVKEAFFSAMSDLDFLPNSPTLMNAGRELGQLAACFVLPVEDSLDSIFEAVKETAKIHQSGGGTGFSFSRLRPMDDLVSTTKGLASGPISFMRVFNMATDVIKQGGTRRGANMGILRIDHPDIEEFVSVKQDPRELTNFNLSVAVSDRFMEAVEGDLPFGLVSPRTGKVVRTVRARDLFHHLGQSAWTSGEPGVLFIDRINGANPTPMLGTIEATNPCGELPLLPYESCCLGSINLMRMVDNGSVNWEKLKKQVHLAVRFLDDVIDVNRYPLTSIEAITKANRKIGLGVMGFAHLLIKLGIDYSSAKAVEVAREVMGFIQRESKKASRGLAEERGLFANFMGSIWDKEDLPQRNATTTTIAPTGTLSLIAGTSSGIEPIFDIRYTRQLLGDITVEVVDPLYEETEDKTLFRTAYAVPPLQHLRIQQAFQENVDNAVSKTVNLPAGATPEDVLGIYTEAYRLGLKGVTVFRDKSREFQVLSCGTHLC
jgi:ribonucleoside-diphosphate reductase alpha chain